MNPDQSNALRWRWESDKKNILNQPKAQSISFHRLHWIVFVRKRAIFSGKRDFSRWQKKLIDGQCFFFFLYQFSMSFIFCSSLNPIETTEKFVYRPSDLITFCPLLTCPSDAFYDWNCIVDSISMQKSIWKWVFSSHSDEWMCRRQKRRAKQSEIVMASFSAAEKKRINKNEMNEFLEATTDHAFNNVKLIECESRQKIIPFVHNELIKIMTCADQTKVDIAWAHAHSHCWRRARKKWQNPNSSEINSIINFKRFHCFRERKFKWLS